MSPDRFYFIAAVLALGNCVTVVVINKQRRTLNLESAEGVKKNNRLKLIIFAATAQTLVAIVLFYFLLVRGVA